METEPSDPVAIGPVAEIADAVNAVLCDLVDELQALLPNAAIEHVGATSHPGSSTKGDIDLAVVVTSDDFAESVRVLESRFDIAQPQNWTPTYASFSSTASLPIGIQLAVTGSPDDFLVPLRDLFRRRPDLLDACDRCKRDAAHLGARGYWEAKDRFLTGLLAEHLPGSRPAQRSRS